MNTKKLMEITEKVDDVFHSYGYVLDHFELSKALFEIVKVQYPEESLKLYLWTKFTGRGKVFI